MNAQSGLSSALSRLLAVSERYLDLKANQNFLAPPGSTGRNRKPHCGGPKRITLRLYGISAQQVRTFPGVLWAMISGLGAKPTFDAAQDAQKAPIVAFRRKIK